MTVRPIDLQSNMSQITQVGKAEQARVDALVTQQHLLERESMEKAKVIDTRTENLKKDEKTLAVNEEMGRGKKRREPGKDSEDEQGKKEKDLTPHSLSKDDKMGRIIDVLK